MYVSYTKKSTFRVLFLVMNIDRDIKTANIVCAMMQFCSTDGTSSSPDLRSLWSA